MLTPTEVDRLLLHSAATLARARRSRGLALNVPEATAIVADTVAEAARDGADHATALAAGAAVLGPHDVLPGVADVLDEVHVEAVFSDGSRLVSVPDPIGGGHLGDDAPGAVVVGARPDSSEGTGAGSSEGSVTIEVLNQAPVPITVSSHFHFFEVNPRLRFDRAAAYGRRLDVAAGSTVTFEQGVPRRASLVPIGGARVVVGFAGLVDGPLDAPGAAEAALAKARACGFADSEAPGSQPPAEEAVERAVADLAARRAGRRA